MRLHKYREEAERLVNGDGSMNGPISARDGILFRVSGSDDPSALIRKAKSVLAIIDETALLGDWPEIDNWRSRLPQWFVDACAPAMSELEANTWLIRWKKMSLKERAADEASRLWSLDNWLYWMEPERRTWFWIRAEPISSEDVMFAIDVEEWPFPWDNMKWLWKAAGAKDVRSVANI